MMKRYAFTIIELVFVIVILGILAAVAIPRLASTVNDANIAKGRSDVAAIRSAIVSERQGRLLQGQTDYINKLHNTTTVLFDTNGSRVLLQYGIITKANTDGHWQNSADQNMTTLTWNYKYRVMGVDHTFEYNSTNGTFNCIDGSNCSDLTN
jgi:general secretion pathway protein G